VKGSRGLCLAAACTCPGLALAASPEALDLATGVPKELLGKTLGLAWSLFAFSLVIALLVELLGTSPSEGKSHGRAGSVAWRALVVVALLKWYAQIFGTVINASESIASSIAPKETWEQFAKQNRDYFSDIYKLKQDAEKQLAKGETNQHRDTATAKLSQIIEGLKPSANYVAAFFGGPLFDALAAFLVAIAQALQWVFAQLSRILLAVFYILGPLALVFAIPRASDSGGRWFRTFVTVASWPIFSSLLLAISTSLMFRTDSVARTDSAAAFGALAFSLLIVCLNLAVPILASAIVGGSIKNIVIPAVVSVAAGAASLTSKTSATVEALLRGRATSAPGAVDGGVQPPPSANHAFRSLGDASSPLPPSAQTGSLSERPPP